jgi:hypothetical protein
MHFKFGDNINDWRNLIHLYKMANLTNIQPKKTSFNLGF